MYQIDFDNIGQYRWLKNFAKEGGIDHEFNFDWDSGKGSVFFYALDHTDIAILFEMPDFNNS